MFTPPARARIMEFTFAPGTARAHYLRRSNTAAPAAAAATKTVVPTLTGALSQPSTPEGFAGAAVSTSSGNASGVTSSITTASSGECNDANDVMLRKEPARCDLASNELASKSTVDCDEKSTGSRVPASWQKHCTHTRGKHAEILTGTVQQAQARRQGLHGCRVTPWQLSRQRLQR
jgi:hypothetical protein